MWRCSGPRKASAAWKKIFASDRSSQVCESVTGASQREPGPLLLIGHNLPVWIRSPACCSHVRSEARRRRLRGIVMETSGLG